MKQNLKKNLPSALLLILLAVITVLGLTVAVLGRVRGALLDSHCRTDSVSSRADSAFTSQLARHRVHDTFHDAAVHRFNGMDFVHAEERTVPAAVPLYRLMVGGILLFRRTCACDEPSCVPVPYDDAQKRHAEHTCKS